MIVVVEGISAAGKTTFCRRFGRRWVPEFADVGSAPGPTDPADAHAAYWVEHNIRRFQAALDTEAEHGFAICDTEPWKSHYDWSMARAGFATMDVFDAAMPIVRAAMSEQRLGFADRYHIKQVPPQVARAQKEGDPTRTRRNFEMHLALQPHLVAWFHALAAVMPGRVSFSLPEYETLFAELTTREPPESATRRFDVSVLDELLVRLPQ